MRRQKDLSVCQHLGPRPASLSCVLEWSSQADTMPLVASSGCLPVPPSPRWIPLFLPPSVALCSLWEGLSYSPEALAVGGVMGWNGYESLLLGLCVIRVHAGLFPLLAASSLPPTYVGCSSGGDNAVSTRSKQPRTENLRAKRQASGSLKLEWCPPSPSSISRAME